MLERCSPGAHSARHKFCFSLIQILNTVERLNPNGLTLLSIASYSIKCDIIINNYEINIKRTFISPSVSCRRLRDLKYPIWRNCAFPFTVYA